MLRNYRGPRIQNDSFGPNGGATPPAVDISAKALAKIVLTVALAALATKTFVIALLLYLGCLVAVSLDPLVRKLERGGFRRGLAIATITLAMTGVIAAIAFILIPSIFNQVTTLIKSLPALKHDLLAHIPEDSAFRSVVADTLQNPKTLDIQGLMNHAAATLQYLLQGITEVFLVLVFSVYLLIDGRRAFKWISDFFSAPIRLKLQATAKETSVVIYSYVMGQFITSVGSAIYTFIALSLLQVPAALTLAALAGILDVLPILGFVIAVIPAMLLALTVSPTTSLIVLGLYILYHAIENYLIIPFVYARNLKVSSLVVLVALLVAGTVGGILGAIAVLPIIASYPIIERIWLVKYLGRKVVTKHAEDEADVEPLPEQVKLWDANPARTRAPTGMAGYEMRKAFGKKVLIVEDDDDIRSMLKDLLETEGYVALVASNGREGLDVLYRNPDIGLILLDMLMPVMNGRTFLDTMKADADFANVPVVFLSGTADSSNSAGAVGVLRKPAEIDVVLDIVDKHYQRTL